MKNMKSKLIEYWDASKDLRNSLPNLVRPMNAFKEATESEPNDNKSFTHKINQSLLKYKEIRMVYNKTNIPPAYLLYILITCLAFIFIGFFENQLTVLIATLYPVYISIKTLQNPSSSKEDTTQWLTYW